MLRIPRLFCFFFFKNSRSSDRGHNCCYLTTLWQPSYHSELTCVLVIRILNRGTALSHNNQVPIWLPHLSCRPTKNAIIKALHARHLSLHILFLHCRAEELQLSNHHVTLRGKSIFHALCHGKGAAQEPFLVHLQPLLFHSSHIKNYCNSSYLEGTGKKETKQRLF